MYILVNEFGKCYQTGGAIVAYMDRDSAESESKLVFLCGSKVEILKADLVLESGRKVRDDGTIHPCDQTRN